jgi:transposase
MAVYVDDMKAKYGRMIMSHMLADTSEELLAMADKIGLSRKWLQYAGTPKEHFDVSQEYKKKAIEAGALQVDRRFMGRLIRKRREDGSPA